MQQLKSQTQTTTMPSQVFHVCQTQDDGDSALLFTTYDEQVAQNEVDRINSNLAAAGIPSWVSCAYVD